MIKYSLWKWKKWNNVQFEYISWYKLLFVWYYKRGGILLNRKAPQALCRNILHILWCPFFAPLIEGRDIKDDKDFVEYFEKVFKIREELESSQDGSTWSFPGSDKSCSVRVSSSPWLSCAQAENTFVFCLILIEINK